MLPLFDVVHTDLCIAFLCPVNVVEHRHDYDPLIKRFWILPVQIPFLMSQVEALDNTCQMNCTAWVAKFNFSTNPCSLHTSSTFVAQLLDESVFETPTQYRI